MVHQSQSLIQETGIGTLGLFRIALTGLFADLQERQRLWVFCHQHVAHVFGKTLNEQSTVETVVDDGIEQHHHLRHLVLERQVNDAKIVLRVEHVQVLDDLLVGDISLTERSRLVEDAEGITHAAVGLLSDDSQRLLFILDALLVGYRLQVVDGVLHRHTLEVIDLTTAEDGGQNLVLLRSGQDEDDMCRGFLQRLQERVEGGRREHVHLVDDEDLVLAYLRRNARLLHQGLDVLHRIVGGSIQLEDVQGTLLVERLTALALITRLTIGRRVLAVDGFGKDAGTGGLSHTTGSAEQIGMGQFARLYGILQCRCQGCLSYDRIKRHRSVFSCRNDIFFHWFKICGYKDSKYSANPCIYDANYDFLSRLVSFSLLPDLERVDNILPQNIAAWAY